MKSNWKWLALVWLAILLAACTPAETRPDPALQTAQPAPTIEETAAPLPEPPTLTPIPVQPTATESQAPTPTATQITLEVAPETPVKPTPVQETDPMPQDPPAEPPTDAYSLELIDKAKTDLAQRTGIPVEEITLEEFRYVTWPDASLGCPEPGMAYAQVLVDGYLIMLRAGLGIYNYHGGDGGKPFLCEGIGGKIIVPPPSASLDK